MSHYVELLKDPHMVTALDYLVIGMALVVPALKFWNMHPIQRVPLLAEYLNEKGVRLLILMWPLVFLSGLFILSCSADHAAEVLVMNGLISPSIMDSLGLAEAIISTMTAVAAVVLSIVAVRRALWTPR